jgi:hypothetical protein
MQPQELPKGGCEDFVDFLKGMEIPRREHRCIACFGQDPCNGDLNLE